MKLLKIVNAHMALGVLAKMPLPAPTAYAVYKLRRELEPDVQFFKSEEMKLAEEFGAKNECGRLIFDGARLVMRGDTDEERRSMLALYTKKRDELCCMDNGAVRAVPVIVLPCHIIIAPEVFEALEGFAAIEVEDAE